MNPESRPWLYPLMLMGIAVVFIAAETLLPVPIPIIAPIGPPTPTAEAATPELVPTSTEVLVPPLTPEEPQSTEPPTAEPTGVPVPPTDTPTPAPPINAQPSAPPNEVPTPSPTPTPIPEAVVIAESGLNLRYGPGVVYDPPIGYLEKGVVLDIVGRLTTDGWIQVIVPNGKLGWISASSKYVQINLDLSTIPVVGRPPAPAPTLLEPPDDTRIDICNRLDLFWTWNGTLGANEYYQVEIWNRFNDFDTPIDVAWIKGTIYRYDYLDIGYHPDYQWRVTVVTGIPAKEKDWSTSENPVWDPSNQYEPISEPSATWRLMVDCSPPPPQPSQPDAGDDDDDDDCSPGDRSC